MTGEVQARRVGESKCERPKTNHSAKKGYPHPRSREPHKCLILIQRAMGCQGRASVRIMSSTNFY